MVSLRLYALGSVVAAVGVVGRFWAQHNQYYPTVVALAQSKAANLVSFPPFPPLPVLSSAPCSISFN